MNDYLQVDTEIRMCPMEKGNVPDISESIYPSRKYFTLVIEPRFYVERQAWI
jgi:hypothetical protein